MEGPSAASSGLCPGEPGQGPAGTLREDLPETIKPSALQEDLVVHFDPRTAWLQGLLRPPASGISPAETRFPSLYAQFDAALDPGRARDPSGPHAFRRGPPRLRPDPSRRAAQLSSLLATQKPGPVRWAGLAPAGSAFYVETRLDAGGLGRPSTGDLGAAGPPGRPSHGRSGNWVPGTPVSPCSTGRAGRPRGVAPLGSRSRAPAFPGRRGHRLGRRLDRPGPGPGPVPVPWRPCLPGRSADQSPSFVVTGAVENASVPALGRLLPRRLRRIDAGVASSGALLVAATGPRTHRGSSPRPSPWAKGLEPRVASPWTLPAGALPPDANAAALLSLGRLTAWRRGDGRACSRSPRPARRRRPPSPSPAGTGKGRRRR